MGLYRNTYAKQIQKLLFAEIGYLQRSRDMSEHVTSDMFNIALAGVEPNVLIDNNTYPIPFSERADSNTEVPLSRFTTEGTVVRNPEQVVLNYNKTESVVIGHRQAILRAIYAKLTHAWAPQADGTYTPVIATTGSARSDGSGLKKMKLADLANAQLKCTELEMPETGRILVLSPKNVQDLQEEDSQLYKTFMNITTGKPLPMFGFDVYVSNYTPKYNKSTGAKVGFQAEAAPSTDTHASIFWHEGEVCRADGSINVNFEGREVSEGGMLMNAEKRFVALPISGKYIGAIYAPAA